MNMSMYMRGLYCMYIFRHYVYKQACMSINILFRLYYITCTYKKSVQNKNNNETTATTKTTRKS